MTLVPSLSKYPKVVSITLMFMAVFIGAVSVFLGVVSVTPMVSADYHRDMRISFNAYAKSLTYVTKYVDRAQLSFYLRNVMGGSQILFGFFLAFLPTAFKHIGNYGLLFVTSSLLLLQLISGATIERTALNIVFTVMLSARLIMEYQSKKPKAKATRSKTSAATKALKTSTPRKNKAE